MPPGNFGNAAELVTLFLAGDLMTGRGIDQVLPHPGDPVLHEPAVKDAREYVEFARQVNGPLPRSVPFAYVWGDVLDELGRVGPDLRIVNLETAVTCCSDYWKGKSIHYRMHPANVPVLTTAGIDCCLLANNHVLDWGYGGLLETLSALEAAGLKSAGAGRRRREAEQPAVLALQEKGRVIVFGFGCESSGIPRSWAAADDRPGVNLVDETSDADALRIAESVRAVRRKGDLVLASIHWGGNWGYEIPPAHRRLAHRLIDECGIDLVHGHSSHHVKGIEVYRGRPILYGCGDFLTDYEGIPGYEPFRDDLGLMYFVTMHRKTGKLVALRMTPTQIKRFRLNRASEADADWLQDVLNREGAALGTSAARDEEGRLRLRWSR